VKRFRDIVKGFHDVGKRFCDIVESFHDVVKGLDDMEKCGRDVSYVCVGTVCSLYVIPSPVTRWRLNIHINH